jgi:hypothetical protein
VLSHFSLSTFFGLLLFLVLVGLDLLDRPKFLILLRVERSFAISVDEIIPQLKVVLLVRVRVDQLFQSYALVSTHCVKPYLENSMFVQTIRCTVFVVINIIPSNLFGSDKPNFLSKVGDFCGV